MKQDCEHKNIFEDIKQYQYKDDWQTYEICEDCGAERWESKGDFQKSGGGLNESK